MNVKELISTDDTACYRCGTDWQSRTFDEYVVLTCPLCGNVIEIDDLAPQPQRQLKTKLRRKDS